MPDSLLVLSARFLAVLALPEDERYRHFLCQAADTAKVWGLLDPSGWVTWTDPQGHAGLPVWPHPVYASACATGDWAGCLPAGIEVADFLEHWLPDMAELDMQVNVFPATGRRGLMVPALQLELQLREKLSLNGPRFHDAGRSADGPTSGYA